MATAGMFHKTAFEGPLVLDLVPKILFDRADGGACWRQATRFHLVGRAPWRSGVLEVTTLRQNAGVGSLNVVRPDAGSQC